MGREIVGLVPVKGASERITAKNIRKFHDTNLFELKLQQLSVAKGFASIIVSSESDQLLDIAKKRGFDVHERDPKYATSNVPMSQVYSYIASEIKGEHIAWINVTNPLAETEIYSKAVDMYNKMEIEEYDCLLSVSEVQEYLLNSEKPINFQSNPWPKSQDLCGVYAMSFIVNILRRENMIRWGSCVGSRPKYYIIDRVNSWDVDFQEDFDFCEMIYKQRCRGQKKD